MENKIYIYTNLQHEQAHFAEKNLEVVTDSVQELSSEVMALLLDAKEIDLPKKKFVSESSDFRKQLKILLESLEKSVIRLSDIYNPQYSFDPKVYFFRIQISFDASERIEIIHSNISIEASSKTNLTNQGHYQLFET